METPGLSGRDVERRAAVSPNRSCDPAVCHFLKISTCSPWTHPEDEVEDEHEVFDAAQAASGHGHPAGDGREVEKVSPHSWSDDLITVTLQFHARTHDHVLLILSYLGFSETCLLLTVHSVLLCTCTDNRMYTKTTNKWIRGSLDGLWLFVKVVLPSDGETF